MPTFLLFLAFVLASAHARAEVAVPDGYRTEHYRAPTPPTLPGATVLDTAGVKALQDQASPLLIDVYPAKLIRHQDGLHWVSDEPRENLPGSVWLPNVGYGEPEPQVARWFERQLVRLSHGDVNAPLLFYCKRDCWMSWNASRRALLLGYKQVYWYPDGTDGWKEAGYALQKHAMPLPLE